jgi:hypothetical protein
MIFKDERYVQICELDADGEIRFAPEFLELTKDFPGIRKFTAHLVSHWDPEYATMLDYFGPDDSEADKYTGIDGDPMDVREDVADLWSYKGIPFDGLDAEWYRDVMRAKLVTTKIPERLIKEYIKASNKFYAE